MTARGIATRTGTKINGARAAVTTTAGRAVTIVIGIVTTIIATTGIGVTIGIAMIGIGVTIGIIAMTATIGATAITGTIATATAVTISGTTVIVPAISIFRG